MYKSIISGRVCGGLASHSCIPIASIVVGRFRFVLFNSILYLFHIYPSFTVPLISWPCQAGSDTVLHISSNLLMVHCPIPHLLFNYSFLSFLCNALLSGGCFLVLFHPPNPNKIWYCQVTHYSLLSHLYILFVWINHGNAHYQLYQFRLSYELISALLFSPYSTAKWKFNLEQIKWFFEVLLLYH